jgi:hypothetical protein
VVEALRAARLRFTAGRGRCGRLFKPVRCDQRRY